MKKTICGLASAAIIAGCSTLGTVVEKYDSIVPEKWKNYKEAPVMKNVVRLPIGYFYRYMYDVDGDMKGDVAEFYVITGRKNTGEPIHGPQPLIYAVNLDGSDNFDRHEIYIDKKMDGLNGNEKQMFPPIPEKLNKYRNDTVMYI